MNLFHIFHVSDTDSRPEIDVELTWDDFTCLKDSDVYYVT